MDTQVENNNIPTGCPHASTLKEGETRYACVHLLYADEDGSSYFKRFTGRANEYILLCEQCASAPNQDIQAKILATCPQCIEKIEKRDWWEGVQGQPEVRTRPTSLRFVHETVRLDGLSSGRILALAPIMGADYTQPRFLVVEEGGSLLEVNFSEQKQRVIRLSEISDRGHESLDLEKPISLHVSIDGQVAAVVNTRGQFGSVFDLRTGQVIMKLQRDTYQIEHSTFPLAFFEHKGEVRLIHGTAWNRLDVSDPFTGEPLTTRQFIWPGKTTEKPNPRPEHYLDYFHGSLLVSPDGEWVVDGGWVWHPVGMIRAWSLRRWLDENVWESEDGQSVRRFAQKDYFWDGPMCWTDNETVAIWGYGGDDEWQIPAAWLFNARTGQEVGWFPGPEGNLAFKKYLFSYSEQNGTTMWDVATGERVLLEAALSAVAYHQGADCFLTLASDGSFIISRLDR